MTCRGSAWSSAIKIDVSEECVIICILNSWVNAFLREKFPAGSANEYELCHLGAANDERAAPLQQHHHRPEPSPARLWTHVPSISVHAPFLWVRLAQVSLGFWSSQICLRKICPLISVESDSLSALWLFITETQQLLNWISARSVPPSPRASSWQRTLQLTNHFLGYVLWTKTCF